MNLDFEARRIDFAAAATSEPEPLDFVLPGLVAGVFGSVIAPGGVGKSFAMLQTAISVALGHDLFRLWDDNITAGRVVILSLEDQREVISQRIWQVCREFPAAAAADRNIDILDIYGLGFTAATRRRGELALTTAWEALIKYCEGARLVVIDTLSRVMLGLNENDASDMAFVVSCFESLCRKTGASVVVAHHANKAAAAAGAGLEQGATRGSSVLTDNGRWQLNLQHMTVADAEARGIDPSRRLQWVHTNMAKVNYGASNGDRFWKRGAGGVLIGADPGSVGCPRRDASKNRGARFDKR